MDGMITLKEYAENKKISYEAVRRQVQRYKKELSGHIFKQGRTSYLDEFAQDFLSERRRASPVVVQIEDSAEQITALKGQIDILTAKLLQAQEQLTASQQQIIDLQATQVNLLEDRDRAHAELSQYRPTWFGLYRKVKE